MNHPIQFSRNGFTIIELVVSMGILAATIVAVAAIFNISSEAASRTEAHAEILEASSALQQSLADDLSHMAGGLLIIESPPPTLVRAEVRNGPKVFRLRHDRLVFIASRGSEGTYQSFTDPTRGDPITDPFKEPVSSPEALVYYGPGIPVVGNGTVAGDRRPFDDETAALPAAEWTFARRAVLLLGAAPNPPITGWTPLAITAFDNGLLSSVPDIYEARMDALVAGPNATATLIAKLVGVPIATPPPPLPPNRLWDLWSPNLTPVSTNLTDSTLADYYARSGFNFQLRLADFRIEWTDGGSVDQLGPDNLPNTGDEDNSTRWFGLAPDRTELPDVTNLDAMKYQARMRGTPGTANPRNPSNPNPNNTDNPNPAPGVWGSIEWSRTGITPDAQAQYRAVWRSDPLNPSSTWQFRPKALKFTYRIYDATQRLKQNTSVDFDEDGVADPINSGNPSIPYVVMRYGQEYSFVVTLP